LSYGTAGFRYLGKSLNDIAKRIGGFAGIISKYHKG